MAHTVPATTGDDAFAAVLLYCREMSLLLFKLHCFFVAAHGLEEGDVVLACLLDAMV